MNPLITEYDQKPPARHWTRVRPLVFVLLSVVMFFGQFDTLMAGHASGGPGLWVEICSEGETYLARVDQGEGGQSDDCAHCPDCIVPSGGGAEFCNPATGDAISVEFSAISFSIAKVIQTTGPEQYWSQCRGPPITSVEKIMNLSTTPTFNSSDLIIANSWGLPWV